LLGDVVHLGDVSKEQFFSLITLGLSETENRVGLLNGEWQFTE
jgi:hypothetical protein